MSEPAAASKRNLHGLAIVAWCVAFLMITIGATVTSRDAGLSIPDAVTNHGGVFPADQIRGGYTDPAGRQYSGGDVFSEYFHRVVGWALGILTIALAFFLYKYDSRAWMRKLGLAAVLLVGIQGALGALGVAQRQPLWLVVPHALLAQTFLALLGVIIYFTSGEGRSFVANHFDAGNAGRSVRRGFLALAAIAFLQVLLGAAFRHGNESAALYIHIGGALIFAMISAGLATVVQSSGPSTAKFTKPILALGGAVMLQIFLGFLAWFFRKPKNEIVDRQIINIIFPTLHVALGALITTTTVALAARARMFELVSSAKTQGTPA
ncbi:MAG: COX15/CtaA family protein [Planctomycetota bacterium]